MSYPPLTDEEETTSTPRGLTPRGAAHARRPSLRRGVSWSLDSHPGSSLQAPPAPAPSREGEVMPVKIECRSVSYFVGRARAETRIMRDVSCAFFPGEVVALMGPSGAGKTTLLNIAACRAAGRVVGDVLINETRASARVFRAIANFVPQDERLMESLSARATPSTSRACGCPRRRRARRRARTSTASSRRSGSTRAPTSSSAARWRRASRAARRSG